MTISDYPIIELDIIDSTNNYAMLLIDANTAQHGMTIVAQNQSAGKGQRGKAWVDTPGQSLLMSIIVAPKREIAEQFVFSASVAVAIAKILQKSLTGHQVMVKWPNDIIVNDKKAGGILIENVLRGSRWTHSVIGLGLNVGQLTLPLEIPFATSLALATGIHFDNKNLRSEVIQAIFETLETNAPASEVMTEYNHLLYKRNKTQLFSNEGEKWSGRILDASPDGTLEVLTENNIIINCHHGQFLWEWE